MPPKKKARTQSIKDDFLDDVASTSSHLSSASSSHDLTPEQLARAYGLARPRAGTLDSEVLQRTCPPKWREDSTKSKSPEIITIESDDEEEESKPKPLKNLKRGSKGKGKEVEKVSCSGEHCSNTPRCLNWLGQDKWEDSVKALKNFRKASGIGYDPSNERDVDLPVGLKNLGATCYVNSFLQVWFRDVTFRAGVYACLPPDNGNVESSPLFQLQVLFAFLQTAQQAVYNPEALVSALKLDKGEQQDAQEFSKLFMSLLDHEFKKQGLKRAAEGGSPDVAKLVQTQFEGSITYGTKCSSCQTKSERNSTFLELEVNLTKDCKLEERIKATLKDEQMIGDNQYHCDTCDQKRDAVRYTVLDVLPPVLHFSILRFVFSTKDFSRSKSQHAISYPLKLDMGQFLPADAHGHRPHVWYDLKGVLMHKGQSAHHGHYVAQVQDGTQNKWFLFDDETVTSIEDLNAPDRYDEQEEEQVTAKPKKPVKTKAKSKPGFSRDDDGNVLPRSKDAYMLVYTRRPPMPDLNASKPADPVPPPLALAKVEELDARHGVLVQEFREKEAVVKADFEKAREAKRSVYRVWDVVEEDENSFLVSKNELRHWIEDGLKIPKPKDKGKGKAKEEDGDTSATAADEPAPASKAATAPPSIDNSPVTKLMLLPTEDIEMGELDSASMDVVPDSTSPTVVGDISPKEPPDEQHTSADAMDVEVQPAQDSFKVISNADIVCEHGHLNPHKAEQIKRVSQLGMMALRDLGVQIEPELMTRRDFCRECVWAIAVEQFYQRDHLTQTELFTEQDDRDDEGVWISKAWLTDWKREIPRMHEKYSNVDPSPDSEPYQSHVVCEHGQLQSDKKRRVGISNAAASVLESLFPDWTPIKAAKVKPCGRCEKAQEKNDKSVQEMKDLATKEKKVLKSFDNDCRLGPDQIVLISTTNNYIIPRAFAKAWVKWSRTPKTNDRPKDIDNEMLFCRHQRLLVDLDSEAETPDLISTVTEKEWKMLKDSYNAKPAIRIWQDLDVSRDYCTSPAACPECIDAQRKDFVVTTLKIKLIGDEAFDENGDYKLERSSSPDDEILVMSPPTKRTSLHPPVTKTYGRSNSVTRSSARIRDQPMMQVKKELKNLEMAKGDTVKDLRVKISDLLNIPTICQRLYYGRQELESAQTVEELGLVGGATLELYEVKEDDPDLSRLDDSIDDSVLKKRKRGREEGFGGTGLFGWESQEAKDGDGEGMDVEGEEKVVAGPNGSGAREELRNGGGSAGRASEADDDEGKIACSMCTFANPAIQDECEMCGLPLREK